jgi:hypothetical protein
VFRGQFDPQIHDFNGDITPFPDGTFWTVPVPSDSVEIELEDREARMRVSRLKIPDYFNVGNALADGAQLGEVDSTVSFEIRWSGGGARKTITDGVNFEAVVVENTVTTRWSAAEKGFSFESQTFSQEFAEIGRERNGVFLR